MKPWVKALVTSFSYLRLMGVGVLSSLSLPDLSTLNVVQYCVFGN